MSVSINLTTVCRTCLSETGPMKSLFTGKSTSTENLPVNQLLTSCTSVQIAKGDGLPQQVCGKCIKLAVRCYIFKQMVEETDSQLRQHLPTVLKKQLKADVQDINQKQSKVNRSNEELNSVEEVIKDEISPANVKNVASVPPILLLVVGNKETIENRRLSEDKRNIPREMTDKTTNTDPCQDVETLIITSADNIKDEESLVQTLAFEVIYSDHNYTKVLGSECTEDEKKETSYYHCKWCGEIFTAIDQYEKHVPEKHGSVFECEECHTTFLSCDELSKHNNLYHSERDIKPKQHCEDKEDTRHLKTALKKRTTNCTVCNKVCKSSWQLKTHMLVHTGERPHMCHICGKRFSQLPHLKTHYVTHTGVKNFVCEICGKKYASYSFLKNHMRHHEKIKKHKCPQCGKMFFLPSELTAHIRVHTGERPFKCSACDKSFCSKSALKTHKLQHEKNEYVEKPFICEKCGRRFTREVFLDNHIVVHRTDLQKIECKVCGREFRNRINLKMHAIRHVASRPFMCNVCGRNFREESLLVSHIRFHMRPKPFECDTCQKKFVDRGALRVHMRTHTGEKPYPCTVCDKRFTVKRSLDAHLRCHTGERPFKCTICDSSFTQRCSLQTHTLLIHNCDP